MWVFSSFYWFFQIYCGTCHYRCSFVLCIGSHLNSHQGSSNRGMSISDSWGESDFILWWRVSSVPLLCVADLTDLLCKYVWVVTFCPVKKFQTSILCQTADILQHYTNQFYYCICSGFYVMEHFVSTLGNYCTQCKTNIVNLCNLKGR